MGNPLVQTLPFLFFIKLSEIQTLLEWRCEVTLKLGEIKGLKSILVNLAYFVKGAISLRLWLCIALVASFIWPLILPIYKLLLIGEFPSKEKIHYDIL
jgi:hypothetical protein